MAGRIVEYKGLTFRVFANSLQLMKPKVSPLFVTHTELGESNPTNVQKAMDDFIKIMNIGIEIADSRSRRI